MKNKELKKKLISYSSLAAGALAITTQAEAAIVYSGLQNITVDSTHASVNIDLNGDSTDDFRFHRFSSTNIRLLRITPLTSVQHIINHYHFDANRFNAGYNIKSTLNYPFSWSNESSDTLAMVPYTNSGGLFNNATGYIGVRFHSSSCSGNDYHYGWIQFRGNPQAVSGTIIDWAYETNCNQAIRTGDTGQEVAIPALTPAGIAVAAGLLSGLGVRTLKKKKNKS
jgi:hypothetical protein